MSLSWWWCLPLGLGAVLAALCVPVGRWLAQEAARTEALVARVAAASRRRVTLEVDGDSRSAGG